MESKTRIERIYLSKGDGRDVYIDCPLLPQHQLDALRFIYKQYKKKNPGIILYDQEGCEKIVDVVLFMKAIHSLLKQPILVICSDKDIHLWTETFQKLANLTDEIVVNPSNPYIKGKKVIIATWSEYVNYHRRKWSMLVMHNDDTKNELFKYNFEADFKIWVTSDNIKENLKSFIEIYQWLQFSNDPSKADIDLLEHNGTDLEKRILRDAFMEDIVIRGSGFESPAIRIQADQSPEKVDKNRRKIKNKDPTDTKTKRSKKKDDEMDTIPCVNIKSELLVENNDLNGHDNNETNLKTKKEFKKVNTSGVEFGPIKRIRLVHDNEQNNYHEDIKFKNEIMDTETINKDIVEVKIENLTDDVKETVNNDEDLGNVSSQDIRLEYSENDTNIPMDVDADTESPSILTFKTNSIKITDCNIRDKVNEIDDLENFYNNADPINNNEDNKIDNELIVNEFVINYTNNEIKVPRGDNDAEICTNASDKSTENKKLMNKSFDSLMDEMQQKAMMKFKGSLLDTLF